MGGEALHGWIFWEIEHTALLTEPHAIWVGPRGSWVDITPHQLPTRKVLFTPDPKVSEKRGHTKVFETPLTKSPKELAAHRFARALSKIWDEQFVGFNKEMSIPMQKVREAAAEVGLPEDVAKAMFQMKLDAFSGKSFGNPSTMPSQTTK
jgi:hypothetical protein